MITTKLVAACLLAYAAINSANAQTTSPPTPKKITGPNWINGTQTVAVCQPQAGAENCVIVAVPKAAGKMTGLLKIRPLRNTSASWWAFTTQTIAVCGMQMSTKKISCVPVEGVSGELLPAYPLRVSQVEELMNTLAPRKAEFLAAGRKVSLTLTPADQMSTNGDHCYDTGECVEDMPVVIIDGAGGGGGGGGGDFGYGFEGWGAYGAGGGGGGEVGDEPPSSGGVDDINPSTGQPYPKITIYPPPPKWPVDITWCSMIGLFCPKDPFANSTTPTPTREQCVAAEGRCFNTCTDMYVMNPESLPGTGTNYHGRFKKCMRDCLAGTGCEHNY